MHVVAPRDNVRIRQLSLLSYHSGTGEFQRTDDSRDAISPLETKAGIAASAFSLLSEWAAADHKAPDHCVHPRAPCGVQGCPFVNLLIGNLMR
jgi:hypothetical protein